MALVASLTASCSGDRDGSITLVTGEETDAFSRAPAPSTLLVEKLALDRTRSELARVALPTDELSLGELPRTDVAAIAVSALDPSGKAVLRGETLYLQWGALEQSPLEIFIQRTGEFARYPRGPSTDAVDTATIAFARYVVTTRGTATSFYDLLSLQTLTSVPTLARAVKSSASIDSLVLFVDDAGATALDLEESTFTDLPAPTGGTWAEIAGGRTVSARDGTRFIIGATRTSGGPSTRVLVVSPGKDPNPDDDTEGPKADLSFASLVTPREGACATWIEGRGLFVFGGSATGAGVELIAPGATVAAVLPFPPDGVRGCGAAALDPGHIFVAGGIGAPGEQDGKAPPRVFDVSCSQSCTPATWSDALGITNAQAIALGSDAAFVLGDDAQGASHAFRATKDALREIPLRNPRRGARLLQTPTESLVVTGGGLGIEQYLE